jgi:hypothetical protein
MLPVVAAAHSLPAELLLHLQELHYKGGLPEAKVTVVVQVEAEEDILVAALEATLIRVRLEAEDRAIII